MITRAEIIEVLENKVRVRIPLLDNAPGAQQYVTDEDLSLASIIVTPGITIQYKVGDIVVVAFENNNLGYPIVLGHLKSALKASDDRTVTITATDVKVIDKLTASTNTDIGKVAYQQLHEVIDTKNEE